IALFVLVFVVFSLGAVQLGQSQSATHLQSARDIQSPPSAAADPPAAAPSAQANADDDDGKLDLAEPDFSVINLPTTLRLPRYGSSFHLTHRFNENLRRDSFGTQARNLFGIDEGASIGLEYRLGLMRHVQALVQRTNIGRTV